MSLLLIVLVLLVLFGGGGGYYGYRGGYYGGRGFGGIVAVVVIVVVLLLLFGGLPARADDGTVISALPFYKTYVEPTLVDMAVAIVMGLFGWGLTILQGHFALAKTAVGLKIEAQARDVLQTAATNGAGRIASAAEGPISKMAIDVKSQVVADEVRKIEPKVGAALATLKIAPDKVQSTIEDLVVAKFGILQAGGGTAAATDPALVSRTAPASTGGGL